MAAMFSSVPAADGAKTPRPSSRLLFKDVSESSGVRFRMTSGETPSREIVEVNGGGVAMLDYDNDGDIDLFFANGATMEKPEDGPGSRLYANQGDGTFSAPEPHAVGRYPGSAAAADLDGDGDLDLAVANARDDDVSVLRNEGDGTFAA